ncbi:MAG: hypothetical protein ABIQ41_07820 [Gemmatimonadales bacterium]
MRYWFLLLMMLAVSATSVQAQTVAPMRTSVLFQTPLVESNGVPIVADSGRNDRVSGLMFGAILGGVLTLAFVSDADGGSVGGNIPVILGGAIIGGGIGYLIGSLLSSD